MTPSMIATSVLKGSNSAARTDNLSSRQQVYRAPFEVCPTCPVRQACGPGVRTRTVTRSSDYEQLEAARVHMQTAAGRAALRKRK